jgi:hypothetical protein
VQALRLTLGGYWGDNISQSIDNIVRILYSSADVIVPRIASSGQQRLGIIQVRALLSLESLLRANSTLVLFECRRYCPSNRFIGPATPWYYSSRALLSLESLHRAFSTLVLFECGLSCPSKRTAHILRVRMLYPSNRFIRPSAPPYSSSMGCLVLRISISGCQCFHLIFPETW